MLIVQYPVGRLISRLYISLLFVRVPFQLIVHIATSVLSGTHLHLSQMKHGRVKCLAQEHNIGAMAQHVEERNMIFL